MNIVIVGAGAIGSLFGTFLAKKNNVVLLGRTPHVRAIQQNGLHIKGKTNVDAKLSATDSIKHIDFLADLLLLTVKSYHTETAIKQAGAIIGDKTMVLSLQNGLDNIEKIASVVEKAQILAGVTTQAAIFSRPGLITHTGKGKTILGELNGKKTDRLNEIVHLFNQVGIETQISDDIRKEIWIKAIINSSINPLTAFYGCKNGYLLENPLLEKTSELICKESTCIAQSAGFNLTTAEMIKRTKKVLKDTKTNYSSMLQSRLQGKKTEIDSINGTLISLGKKHNTPTQLNEILYILVTSVSHT